MNHTLLTTDKAEIIGFELPENAKDISINRSQDDFDLKYLQFDCEKYKGLSNYDSFYLPAGNWQLLGWSDEITEKQAAMVVDDVLLHGQQSDFNDFSVTLYKNYAYGSYLDSAIQSLKSLISYEGITKRLYLIYKLK